MGSFPDQNWWFGDPRRIPMILRVNQFNKSLNHHDSMRFCHNFGTIEALTHFPAWRNTPGVPATLHSWIPMSPWISTNPIRKGPKRHTKSGGFLLHCSKGLVCSQNISPPVGPPEKKKGIQHQNSYKTLIPPAPQHKISPSFFGVNSWVTFCLSQSSQAIFHWWDVYPKLTHSTPSGFLEPQVGAVAAAVGLVYLPTSTHKNQPFMYIQTSHGWYGLVNLSKCYNFLTPQNYRWSTYSPLAPQDWPGWRAYEHHWFPLIHPYFWGGPLGVGWPAVFAKKHAKKYRVEI